MYAIFALLSLLLLLLLPGDNADLLKINYGKLLEQCMEIMNAYIFIYYVCFEFDCMHSLRFLIIHHGIELHMNSHRMLNSIRFESLPSIDNGCCCHRRRSIVIAVTNAMADIDLELE